jgi:diguanylate cyclase (GGDEF)-like protein
MRVLIAEDDTTSRLLLESTVVLLGHEAVPAVDGQEAWQLFNTDVFDAVISDWSMPGMNGLELCRHIRGTSGPRYPYFIFLTSLVEKPRVSEGIKSGADDYLTKPLDQAELESRLVVAQRITELYRKLAEQQSALHELNKKLFEQSRTDALTQLGSRLKLAEDLEIIYARAERYGEGYAAVMCDIDCFKLYNDHEGHQAGDEVLRQVARTLAEGCRREDAAYRYGGEEFLLIFRAQSLDDARAGAERHRAAIEALKIPHSSSPFKFVTISMGAALLSDNTSSAAWLKRADDALYEAKRLGRNCIVPTTPAGEICCATKI